MIAVGIMCIEKSSGVRTDVCKTSFFLNDQATTLRGYNNEVRKKYINGIF